MIPKYNLTTLIEAIITAIIIFIITMLFIHTLQAETIDVYFSPSGGAQQAIIQEIDQAKKQLLVQAYGFSSVPISKAIYEAKRRNIDVEIILDKCNETQKYSCVKFLTNKGILLLIDYKPHIAHSKIMIIDEKDVITGSYNFTKAAEYSNTENILIIKDNLDLAKKYIQNFRNRQELSYFLK